MQLYRKIFQDRHFLSKSHDVYLLPINEMAQTPEASRQGGRGADVAPLLQDVRLALHPCTIEPFVCLPARCTIVLSRWKHPSFPPFHVNCPHWVTDALSGAGEDILLSPPGQSPASKLRWPDCAAVKKKKKALIRGKRPIWKADAALRQDKRSGDTF